MFIKLTLEHIETNSFIENVKLHNYNLTTWNRRILVYYVYRIIHIFVDKISTNENNASKLTIPWGIC